jgi:hypothetical protein
MTIQRTKLLALLTACLLALGTATAQAQEPVPLKVRIAVPNSASVTNFTDQIIVFGEESGTRTFTETCMTGNGFTAEHPIQRVIAIDPSHSPAATRIEKAFLTLSLSPGTRLIELTHLHDNCVVDSTDYDIFEAEIAGPQNSSVALVITPADSLTEDHEAVVNSGAAASGISESVAVTQGEKPWQTEMICDIDLYAGDRLSEFVEVDYDPNTGETMYACWLEY